MPFYDYHCDACGLDFEKMLSISKYDEPQSCVSCGETARKKISEVNFNLTGDDWASKNNRIAQQRAKRNAQLTVKQNERLRDQPPVQLAPNVNGERVATWSDAQKLAASKGKNAASYEPMVRKEQALKK